MHIGHVLMKWREELALRQQDVAKQTGIPQASYSYFERYGRMPNFDVACRLCYFLRKTPNDLARELGIKVWGDPPIVSVPVEPEKQKDYY